MIFVVCIYYNSGCMCNYVCMFEVLYKYILLLLCIYHITGYFQSRNFSRAYDKLNFEGSIFVHFLFLAFWINIQFNFKEFHSVGVKLLLLYTGCVCVCVFVRACVRACVCVCVCDNYCTFTCSNAEEWLCQALELNLSIN